MFPIFIFSRAVQHTFVSVVVAGILVGQEPAFATNPSVPLNPVVFGERAVPPVGHRPFSIDDMLRRRTIGDVQPSPTYRLVAVTISRPAAPGERFMADNRVLDDNANGRADLFILDTGGGAPAYTSQSIPGLRTAYAPVWSADGSRLAFLGILRNGITKIVVWDAETRRSRSFKIHSARRGVPLRGARGVATDTGLVWVNHDTLAFVAAPDRPDRLTATIQAWRKTWAGDPSVRIWSTTTPVSCRAEDALTMVSAETGLTRTLAVGQIKGASFSPAADSAIVVTGEARRSIAFNGRKAFPPQANLADFEMRAAWRADIVRIGDGERRPWLGNAEGPVSQYSVPAWSRDGRRAYAVTRTGYVEGNGPVDLITRDIATGKSVHHRFTALHSAELAGDIYLLKARVPEGVELPIATGPNFAREPHVALEDLTPDQRDALGLDIKFLARKQRPAAPMEQAVFDGWSAGAIALFHADAPDGTYLWAVGPGGKSRVLLSTNGFVAGITRAAFRRVEYQVGGEERSGVLFLPTVARGDGATLPLVMTAYPGFSAPKPYLSAANASSDWQLRSLLAHGFAVFVVDFRAFPKDGAGVLTERIMREMIPAIAAAKALPEIDSRRIGYFGHSYGAVTGLTALAQVRDFAAAVISAPVANLARYGLSPRPEVADLNCAPTVTSDLQEVQDADGFLSFDGPIGDHLPDYLAQSPIWQASRIVTPTLMVRGELDSFNGADELFAALAEKGVDAELAVYRAEPHSLGSPGNVHDASARIIRWFETYLRER
ncbi:prolyl oligopeptidase family serine peptidase [Hephaestia sp. GCM10023244]|uniref:S9 family peptidase n=1 Tax=unclassified Hephaestia TaxID=2631281 RepID=UPI00207749DA|nr:prolyl oligopeptidase family serine peptidase [Hephaestia sp. MAHUQ-44]MCM8732397.1 prolyl oligopeptidase family serine peptidase [Hephaestia sp. MAHUQ-44]